MANPYETPIPGGTNANFNSAPGLTQDIGGSLTTPGRQERPRTERIDQLRSLLVMGGQAVAGALGNEAQIQIRAQQRASQRRAEVEALAAKVRQQNAEADNEREKAYRASMAARQKGVEQAQFDILRDPRSVNNEWVMNEAVSRQGNAGYPEEKSAWNDFIIRYQTNSRQDAAHEAERTSRVANADIINDRRIAGKTAKNAIDTLWNGVQLDDAKKQQLIGDGRNIGDRVNQHVMEEAMKAAPELFNLKKNDPFYATKLDQQTILLDELESRASATIVQPLTKQFIANSQKSAEETGAHRIDVASQSFAEGDLTATQYHDVVGDVLRTQFAHVDPLQRDQVREKLYRQQFNRLAGLLDQPDPGKALERMESLISIADLDPNERQVIREQIIGDKFPKAIEKRLKETIQSKMGEMSGITRVNEGAQIVPRDPKSVQVDMLENGTYREIAGTMLDSLGISDDPAKLTPLQANLLGVITSTVGSEEEKAMAIQKKAMADVNLANKFFGQAHLTSEESSMQWKNGAMVRMLTGNLSADDPVFQSMASDYKAQTGQDFPWDGTKPVEITPETKPLVNEVARQEGAAWGKNSLAPVPADLHQTIESMTLYESPDRAEVALNFWNGLGSEGQERVGKGLSARAQMALMEGARLYSGDPSTRALNMAEVANRMRVLDENSALTALRLSKDQAGLSTITPDPRFHYDYATALSKILGKDVLKDEYGGAVLGFDFDVPGGGFGDPNGQGAVQGLVTTLGTKSALVPLFAQMAVVQLANPGTDLEKAATVVVARMRAQGYKIVSGTHGKQIVKDTWGHYPTEGTPSDILREQLNRPMSALQAKSFIGKMQGVGPQTSLMAKDGILPKDILWSHLQEQATAANGGKAVPLPSPDEWGFAPDGAGPMFNGLMSQRDGGIPMQISIPGSGRTQMLVDKSGNPLLLSSATRRTPQLVPVDRSTIPGYHLTPQARKKVPLKPDSASKMHSMFLGAEEVQGIKNRIKLKAAQSKLDRMTQ